MALLAGGPQSHRSAGVRTDGHTHFFLLGPGSAVRADAARAYRRAHIYAHTQKFPVGRT